VDLSCDSECAKTHKKSRGGIDSGETPWSMSLHSARQIFSPPDLPHPLVSTGQLRSHLPIERTILLFEWESDRDRIFASDNRLRDLFVLPLLLSVWMGFASVSIDVFAERTRIERTKPLSSQKWTAKSSLASDRQTMANRARFCSLISFNQLRI